MQDNRVVCSLTTRPEQPYYFEKVLQSLTKQFDDVYLTLPFVSCKGIKYKDLSYKNVTVVRTPKDYGPITKFFGALEHEKNPNTIIVVLDDDIIYDENLRATYEKYHHKYPNDVLSGAGMIYKYYSLFNNNSLVTSGRRENFPFFFPSLIGDNRTQTVAGYTGISFRRKLLHKNSLLNFIDKHKSKICFINDDIVISAFFNSKNIQKRCIPMKRCTPPTDKDTESLSSDDTIYLTQFQAFKELREYFQHDLIRFDCICMIDIIIITVIIVIVICKRSKTF